ncbi:MAG: hypothetical protein ABWX67_12935 [Allosphingosinicella sp.]
MPNLDSRFRSRPSAPCLELALRLEDGSPWRLTVSAGMERFIGAYPLVEGLDPDGPLLRFRAASPT